MAVLDHEEVSEMLAIYSLDALPADEAALVEQHLADCPRCQADLASLREVAGLLAGSATSPPEELWDRIAAELTEPASGPPLTPPVIADRHEPEATGLAGGGKGLVAALLAVLGVLSYRVVNLDNRVGGLQSALAQHGPNQQVALALADPAHQKVQLTAKGSTMRATSSCSLMGGPTGSTTTCPPYHPGARTSSGRWRPGRWCRSECWGGRRRTSPSGWSGT